MVYQEHADGMASSGDVPTADSTYNQLKSLLLAGGLTHGEPLVERSLAEQLGVSRTPVREAIRQLGKDGLVRIVEGKGAFVPTYTIEDICEIYQVREALEPLAARLGCRGIPEERLDYFEGRFATYVAQPELRQADPDAWQKLGQAFHETWIVGSRNTRLIQVMEGMRDQVELFRRLGTSVPTPPDRPTALDEHIGILAALRQRDPLLAEQRVRSHLQNALTYRLDALYARF